MVIYFFSTPPLEMRTTNEKVVINLQRLGEYNSALKKLTLVDCITEKIVWELRAKENKFIALWTFELAAGANSSHVAKNDLKQSEITNPKNARSFELKKNNLYKIVAQPSGFIGWAFETSKKFEFK